MSGFVKIIAIEEEFGDKGIEVQFCKCSYEKCLSNKLPETGDRIYYGIHMVMQGAGFLEYEGKKIKLKKNDVFVVYPGRNQCYYPDQGNPWKYIWVDLMGKDLEELFRMCGAGPELPYIAGVDSEIAVKFQSLLSLYNTADSTLLECSLNFMEIVAKLISNHKARHGFANQYISPKNLVREAIIFINNNYRLNITLSDVSSGIGVSSSYLISLFAKEAKISPMKYLTMYRIASACELLAKGELNVNEVGREVGYNDPLYFSRCFSSVKGCSPRDYTKKLPGDDPWKFLRQNNIDYR